MNYKLLHHLQERVSLTNLEKELIESYVSTVMLKKKEHLLREGNLCKEMYFVESGLLRLYCTKGNGMEQTTQFVEKNLWVTDYAAFYGQAESSYSIQALENTVVNRINRNDYNLLQKAIPKFGNYFSIVFQRTCATFKREINIYSQILVNLFIITFVKIYQILFSEFRNIC